MNLKDYLLGQGRGGHAALAKQLNVSPSFLSQMATGAAPIAPARCVEIEVATGGVVSRLELRPLDGASIWPELYSAGETP